MPVSDSSDVEKSDVRSRLGREGSRLTTALTFLTRLPVSHLASAEVSELVASTRWFPLVGAILGLLMGTGLWAFSMVFPDSIAVALSLCLSVMLTGAFHEDGLADVADSTGVFGINAKLAIMRDSRIGTFGVLVLILSVLMRFVTLWEILKIDIGLAIAGLVAAHVLGRWASVCLMATEPYARPEAVNKVVVDGVTPAIRNQASLVALTVFLLLMLWQGTWVLFLFLPAWVLMRLCGFHFRRAFGGITGDCLGTTIQVVELVVLLNVVAIASLA